MRSSGGDIESSFRHIKSDFMTEPDLFLRLQGMARSGRIHIARINLRETARFSRLISEIHDTGERISVIDFSNAWWEYYAGPTAILKLADGSPGLIRDDAVWLFTYRRQGLEWIYFGFHTSQLLNQSMEFVDLASVINTLYYRVLDQLEPLEGLNLDLKLWLPPQIDIQDPTLNCDTLLVGQTDFIKSKILAGRLKL